MRRRTSGFTLVELLVVIGIIGVLVGMLLPAVQAAREAGRRAQCANNVRQLALAVHNYENTRKVYPPSMTSTASTTATTWSGLARILPFLEETAAYQNINFNLGYSTIVMANGQNLMGYRVPEFICASESNDVVRSTTPPSYGLNYAFNEGVWPVFNPAQPLVGQGVFYCNSRIANRQITDGTSKTLMFAEVKMYTPYVRTAPATATVPTLPADICNLNPSEQVLGTNVQSNQGHTEWDDGKVWHVGFTTVFTPNTQVLCNYGGVSYDVDFASSKEGVTVAGTLYAAVTSRSYHGGAVNTAMMDGSVQLIADDIDINLWRAMSTRCGAETISMNF